MRGTKAAMNTQLTLDGIPAGKSSKKFKKLPFIQKLDAGDRRRVADHIVDIVKENRFYSQDVKAAKSALAEADRLRRCGCASFWRCDSCGEAFKTPISCNSRICSRCQSRYAAQLRQSMNDLLTPYFARARKGWFFSLLTLTVQKDRYGDKLPDRADIKRFYSESSKFLKLFFGKYKSKLSPSGKLVELRRKGKRIYRGSGAIAIVELGSRNNNLHLHAFTYGPYIPQRKLSSTWNKITGDSYVVHIEKVRSPKQASNYVLKYIAKPPGRDSYHDLASYSMAIKGSRRLRTIGIFYNAIKRIKEKIDFACPYCRSHLHLENDQLSSGCGRAPDLYPLLRKARGSPGSIELPENYNQRHKKFLKAVAEFHAELALREKWYQGDLSLLNLHLKAIIGEKSEVLYNGQAYKLQQLSPFL
jgi:hypothetical protein